MLIGISDVCLILDKEVRDINLKDFPFSKKIDAAVKFASAKDCNINAVRRINTDIRIHKAILNNFCKKTKF